MLDKLYQRFKPITLPDSPGYVNYGIGRVALDRLINNPEMMI
ncbi:MAG: hypothetical protein WCS98_09875 [Bacillota bacterium]